MGAPLTFDVGLDDTGDLPVQTSLISGFDLILQRVSRRLRTFRGEWLLDGAVGLPFFDWIQQKPPQVDSIGAVVRRAIETTPGVTRVENWTGSYDANTRELTYGGDVITTDGDASIVVIPLGEPRRGNRNPALRLVIRARRIAPP